MSRLHSQKNLSPLKICLRVFKEVLVGPGRGLTGPGNLSAFSGSGPLGPQRVPKVLPEGSWGPEVPRGAPKVPL